MMLSGVDYLSASNHEELEFCCCCCFVFLFEGNSEFRDNSELEVG